MDSRTAVEVILRTCPFFEGDSVFVPYGVEDTPMHAVTPPKNDKHIIKLPPLDHTIRRGHRPHRGGSGSHGDRRLKRLRSRGDNRRAALGDG
jgi:hypothetical protein